MSSTDLAFSLVLLDSSSEKNLICKFRDYIVAQLPELSKVVSTSIAVGLLEEVVLSLDQLYDFLG